MLLTSNKDHENALVTKITNELFKASNASEPHVCEGNLIMKLPSSTNTRCGRKKKKKEGVLLMRVIFVDENNVRRFSILNVAQVLRRMLQQALLS